jgi:hypothetical protein
MAPAHVGPSGNSPRSGRGNEKMTEKPLDAGGWFVIHNWVFDVAMRQLSPNAWKVLSWAIRQTWGWADANTNSGRKEADQISYSQFMRGTGIKGRSTLANALRQCLEKGYLLRQQIGTDRRSGNPLFSYTLNTDYKISGTEIGLLSGTEIGLLSGTEMGPTKRKKRKKENAVVVLTAEQESSCDALVYFGIEPVTARRLAQQSEPAQVLGWIAYARGQRGLDNPAALVVARLRAGEPAPEVKGGGDGDDRRRLIEELDALGIQH